MDAFTKVTFFSFCPAIPREAKGIWMRRINSYLLGIDSGSDLLFADHETDGKMWAGKGAREVRKTLRFSAPYREAPHVMVSVSLWDTDHQTNQRIDITAENITTTGFDMVCRTWGDTRIARIRADWTALGEVDRPQDDWVLY
ncbi:hypothetical protein ABIE69_001429 [Rhodobacteraceae bacterium MBR-64]|jgi:hypothetical protein